VQRREVLATGGRLAAVGALGGLTGCLSFVYPRVRGRVTRKSIRGTGREADSDADANGGGGRDRLVAAVSLDGRRVADERYRDAFGDGLTVSTPVAERLARQYDAVTYRVRIVLEGRDPVNGVPAGAEHTYQVARHAFNAARVDEVTAGRVARFGRSRLVRVDGAAVGSPGGREG
jgi:hypothetical protein